MRKKKLVRSLIIGILAAAALSVSACGKKAEESSAAASASQAEESNAEVNADEAAIEALNPVRPESLGTVKLGAYKGITVNTAAPYTVTDQDVESYLEYGVLSNYTEEVDTVEDGDTVNIDYKGTIDGKAFDGGTAAGQSLTIGSGTYIDGFESGLIGAKKGDTVTLNLKFPEDYGKEELNGKAVVFEVTVNSITRKRVLDDALAKEIDASVDSVAALKEKIRGQLQENYDYSNKQQLAYDAIQAVVADSEVTPTEEAIDWKVDDLVKNYYEPMLKQSYNLGLAQMLSMQGQTLDQFKADLRDTAKETIQQILVMEEIAKEQKFEVTDADIDAFATKNGTTAENLKSGASEEEIKEAVLQEMATNYVEENANVVYEEAESSTAAEDSSAAQTTEESAQ